MNNSNDERTEIRRKDREVKDESWIKDILRYEPYCTVATATNNQPFIRPSAFYYSESDHAKLPWNKDKFDKPLTLEWRKSLQTKQDLSKDV